MTHILVSSGNGCRVFSGSEELSPELPGHHVGAISTSENGVCVGIVDEKEIWERDQSGRWLRIAVADVALESLVAYGEKILAGGMNEAAIFRVLADGGMERLSGFDIVAGREEWFAGGPPLGVRSLAVTADNAILFAGVHVGGIPRSLDGGASWIPTIPVAYDVHQVCVHPEDARVVAAAAAVGLCVSEDGGETWRVITPPTGPPYSLAVAAAGDEFLFSTQDGPFATRSQVWRWTKGSDRVSAVRDGLPEYMDGRVDTNQIAVGLGGAAIVDCGGNLWASTEGTRGWKQQAGGLGYVLGLAIVDVPAA